MKIRDLHELRKGIALGLLWTIEIAVNNLLYPPLPGRDIFDDLIWAIVAVVILIVSITSAYKSKKMLSGIKTGFWWGLGSGAVACVTALLFIVFGMKFILSDPLVIAEWKDQMVANAHLGMKTYFTYQTLAGAFLHLIVLGIGMGLILGLLGGVIGWVVANANRRS